MELLASLFVGKPPNILAVVALFLVGYLILIFYSRKPISARKPAWLRADFAKNAKW
jgi:hypothetical protein